MFFFIYILISIIFFLYSHFNFHCYYLLKGGIRRDRKGWTWVGWGVTKDTIGEGGGPQRERASAMAFLIIIVIVMIIIIITIVIINSLLKQGNWCRQPKAENTH